MKPPTNLSEVSGFSQNCPDALADGREDDQKSDSQAAHPRILLLQNNIIPKMEGYFDALEIFGLRPDLFGIFWNLSDATLIASSRHC